MTSTIGESLPCGTTFKTDTSNYISPLQRSRIGQIVQPRRRLAQIPEAYVFSSAALRDFRTDVVVTRYPSNEQILEGQYLFYQPQAVGIVFDPEGCDQGRHQAFSGVCDTLKNRHFPAQRFGIGFSG